ncbi:pyridoxine 5'-phosphate synthase [Marivirga harenae]|uniref:pyridoxine 5'-phosphate synthase n=1 Tax=Marivirga harenae TaxID=2010992 RepID=UPI0026E0A5C1|nr:pyridoxine 5'-phosphate synthase [Marivirga harenae]WKV13687.1 pyridoxine 5'-phosphate synthase [Marivirga harenae]
MTRLSVNINKIATLRNARGGKNPNVVNVAKDCERFGAEGITIHPRPDERHITTQDVYDLAPIVTTEFNIEGYPDQRFLDLVKKNKPAQATLVPDPPGVLTSNAGWDTVQNHDFLKEIISELKGMGVRTSVFIGTEPKLIEYAAKVGTDRIELYTEPYAANYAKDRDDAVAPFVLAAKRAKELGLGVNAGHDLSLENLKFLKEKIPFLDEVSIGHALVCDALYFGLENSIQLYLRELREA